MSKVAETFDTNQQKLAGELRHSKESASASEMSKIAETFDDCETRVLQNLGFRRGQSQDPLCLCSDMSHPASSRHVPGKSDGTRRTPLWTHCVDSFDHLKNPISETL